MPPLADYQIPTLKGDVQFVLEEGATLYALNVTGDASTVTVYINHHVNQSLLADLGDAFAWLGCVSGYAPTVLATVAGFEHPGQPSGYIVIGLHPEDPRVLTITARDGLGGEATAQLDREGAAKVVQAAGLMIRHL